MLKLCRVDEVRQAEAAACAAGCTPAELMASAGRGVAEQIARRMTRAGTALFLVGPGNNGGDGLVAACDLVARGWRCLVWGWQRQSPGEVPAERRWLERLEWIDSATVETALRSADVVVDAVFGIGWRQGLPSEVGEIFEAAWNERVLRGTPLIAVDTPSGVDCDTGEADPRAFRADLTVTLGLPKVGLYRPPAFRYTGLIECVDIGLPLPPTEPGTVAVVTLDDVRRWLPRRHADTHKRAVGTVLVVGGAPGFYGAPRLAAEAAARAGAGLVTLAVIRSLVPAIAATLPEVTFLPLPEGELGAGPRMADLVHQALPRYDVLLIGPGLGQETPVPEFLGGLFGLRGMAREIGFGQPARTGGDRPFSGKAVVDADGLNWLATQREWWVPLAGADLVLTPHPGELARLMQLETKEVTADAWGAVAEAACRFGQHVVLKYGHATLACPDGTLIVSPQVHASLATAGTGDVLAGLVAGLWAQGLGSREAAAGALAVGSAAMMNAVERAGTLGLLARDLIAEIPGVLAEVYDPRWQRLGRVG